MQTYFKTHEEALQQLKDEKAVMEGYCPVIKNSCSNNCLCLTKPYAREVKSFQKDVEVIQWCISKVYCTHPFITGEISVNIYNQ